MLFALTSLILVHCIQARPIPPLLLDPCPSSCHNSRTLSNIVWSSLVTLFACIWVAVHPNVPAFTNGILAWTKERVKLLLTAVVAPELIVLFAMRQWVCARDAMQSAFGRERGCTQTHGFFLVMGGFILYDSDGERPLYPLDLKNIEDLLQKGLAIIQTGWFIMQCVARGAEHLAIAELEVITVAFAFLNLITYIFWWDKPLNVTCPIRIVLKAGHSAPEPRSPEIVLFLDRIGQVLNLVNPDGDRDVDLFRGKHVPTFYAGRVRDESFNPLFYAEMIVAMIFGGIHCIAWSFSFPTHVEQILWRASSIAIVSIPFLILVISLLEDILKFNSDLTGYLGGLSLGLSLFIYPAARVILLILSLISLRSLPPSAFYTVRWITFMPHIG